MNRTNKNNKTFPGPKLHGGSREMTVTASGRLVHTRIRTLAAAAVRKIGNPLAWVAPCSMLRAKSRTRRLEIQEGGRGRSGAIVFLTFGNVALDIFSVTAGRSDRSGTRSTHSALLAKHLVLCIQYLVFWSTRIRWCESNCSLPRHYHYHHRTLF